MTGLEFHECANLFPLMAPPEIAGLAQDIRENGQKQSIVLHEGRILDGRNRYRACQAAHIEPRFTECTGPDPLAYVLSLNLERRHLSPSQRSMIAARAATLKAGRPPETASKEAVSQTGIAARLKVSRASVQRAKTVLDHGGPELVAKVERGKVSVSAAAKSLQPEPRTPLREKVDVLTAGRSIESKPLPEEQRKAIMPMRAALTMWLRQMKADRIDFPALATALSTAFDTIEKAFASPRPKGPNPTPT